MLKLRLREFSYEITRTAAVRHPERLRAHQGAIDFTRDGDFAAYQSADHYQHDDSPGERTSFSQCTPHKYTIQTVARSDLCLAIDRRHANLPSHLSTNVKAPFSTVFSGISG